MANLDSTTPISLQLLDPVTQNVVSSWTTYGRRLGDVYSEVLDQLRESLPSELDMIPTLSDVPNLLTYAKDPTFTLRAEMNGAVLQGEVTIGSDLD